MNTRKPFSSFAHAFSIVEVMFAVMILGIGFILVAAMFPVAIQQTQATVDETRVRLDANNGAFQLLTQMRMLTPVSTALLDTTAIAPPAQVYRYEVMPGTPAFVTSNAELTQLNNLYRSLRTSPDDSRYSWLMAYSYNYDAILAPNPVLYMTVFGLKATTISGTPEVFADRTAFYDNTGLLGMTMNLEKIPGSPTRIVIDPANDSPDPLSRVQEAAVEGGVILIPANVVSGTTVILSAGTVLRLGSQVDLPSTDQFYLRTWELAPDSPQPAANHNGAIGALLGRALTNPSLPWSAANPHSGATQVRFVTQYNTVLN